MILAKEYINLNIRKLQKNSLNSIYTFCIYELSEPIKLSKSNLKQYNVHHLHLPIGLILNDSDCLDKHHNSVHFEKKIAIAPSINDGSILKLVKPKHCKYTNWIETMKPYILAINPSYTMLPINNSVTISTPSECNYVIQEINTILFGIALDCDVIIYQDNEHLSSLAYIIQNVAFPNKTSLCLNLDFMLNDNYNLTDLKGDILRFDISRKISMLYTNNFTMRDKDFKSFLSNLNSDIIIYGNKI